MYRKWRCLWMHLWCKLERRNLRHFCTTVTLRISAVRSRWLFIFNDFRISNLGQCIENGQDYECLCDMYWTGKNCENFVPPSPCESEPCENGVCSETNVYEYRKVENCQKFENILEIILEKLLKNLLKTSQGFKFVLSLLIYKKNTEKMEISHF